MLPQSGSSFGRYDIGRRLGQGGMGVVFAATHRELGRDVALKVLAPDLSDEQAYRNRFLREARALAVLDSPYVVRVHDAGEQDGWLFIATELVPDGDLTALLRDGGLPLPIAADLVGQVAQGLQVAHEAGILHRDIKPSNVLIRKLPDGALRAVLCDLGISTVQDAEHTATVGVIGTPRYMAPERHEGADASVATDIYSLGCLLWAVVTGRAPYEGTASQVLLGHLRGGIPQLPGDSTQERAINQVIATAMAKDPDERFATAGEFADALAEIADPSPVGADTVLAPAEVPVTETEVVTRRPQEEPAERPVRKRSRRRKLATVCAAVGAIVTVAILLPLYFTGQLGFGPLSSEDRAAATAITERLVDDRLPAWASGSTATCATDHLVGARRTDGLIEDGWINADRGVAPAAWDQGRDGWRWWRAYLDCAGDWGAKLARVWGLSSDDCLHGVGADDVAALLADQSRLTSGYQLQIARARSKLNHCYVLVRPGRPTVHAKSAYESVAYSVATVRPVPNALRVGYRATSGGAVKAVGRHFRQGTRGGGVKACSRVQAVAEYGWTSRVGPVRSVCGRSRPPRLWWTKEKTCTWKPGCVTWRLSFEGMKPNSTVTVHFEWFGGYCGDGNCHQKVQVDDRGRNIDPAGWWNFMGSASEFTATIGGITARIPG